MGGVRRVSALAAIIGLLMVASPAWAQTSSYVGVNAPQVGSTDTGAVGGTAAVLSQSGGVSATGGAIARPTPARALALTGGDILGLTALGALSIVAGAVLVRSLRRRTEPSTTTGGPLT